MTTRNPAEWRPKTPEHEYVEIDAERLRQEFEAGDMLAPFECCAIWAKAGLDSASLPSWARDRLFEIAAKYYDAGIFKENPPVTPRRLIEMTPKERKGALPSLDTIAGLVGGRGTPGAWLKRAESGRDELVQVHLDCLMEERDQDKQDFLKTEQCTKIPVFVEQGPSKGQFRSDALHHIADIYRVKGHEGMSRAKTMRRRSAGGVRYPGNQQITAGVLPGWFGRSRLQIAGVDLGGKKCCC